MGDNLDYVIDEIVKIVTSIIPDKIKLRLMEKIEDDGDKIQVATSIKSDEIKLQIMDNFDIFAKDRLAITLSSDEAKLKAMEKIESKWDAKDMFRFSFINFTLDSCKAHIVKSMKSDDLKLQLIKKEWHEDNFKFSPFISDSCKVDIVESIKSDELKLQSMDEVDSDYNKWTITRTLRNTDETKMKSIKKLKNFSDKKNMAFLLHKAKNRVEVLKYFENDEQRCEVLKELKLNKKMSLLVLKEFEDKSYITRYRQSIKKWDYLVENIEEFLKAEGYEDRLEDIKNVLFRMYEKNNNIVQTVNFGILDKKYLEVLGEDNVNFLSCYPDAQRKVLSLNDGQMQVFKKCLNEFLNSEPKEDWTLFVNDILNHISEYNELINNIGELEELSCEDIKMISQVMQNHNWCEIKNIDEVRCYYDIVKEKCNEIIQNDDSTIEQKRDAVVQKIFGHSWEYAQNILIKFGVDNENIDEGEMKEYVKCLQEIKKIKQPQTLKEIFNTCEFVKTDKICLERNLKQEYCKKYNEGLYVPKEEDLELGTTNIYNAGTDFKIIIHAVGAFSDSNPKNYKDDWNRPSLASQQVCTSYIRNDMIGTAPIKNVCYGFSYLAPDSLILSGTHDINSDWGTSLVVTGRYEMFYTPDNQINHTDKYNEMDFRRVQDGKRLEPDYIVVFKENGIISNMSKAKKASKDWGDLPIVVIDKNACLKSEEQKVHDMLNQYENNPTSKELLQIMQKVRNNKETNPNFCEDIQNKIKRLYDEKEYQRNENVIFNKDKTLSPDLKVGFGEMEENYSMIGANERKSEADKMKKIYMQIQELTDKEKKENGREKN